MYEWTIETPPRTRDQKYTTVTTSVYVKKLVKTTRSMKYIRCINFVSLFVLLYFVGKDGGIERLTTSEKEG